MKSTVKLENWSVVPRRPVSAYQAPETIQLALHGDATGHPEHPGTHEVTTSSIINVDEIDGKVIVETKTGTLYELGTVDPIYESHYPDARARLIQAGKDKRKAMP